MTSLAFGIIRITVLHQAPVRIMAGSAGDPPVGRVIATAIGKTVELKADIQNPAWPVGRDVGPARMAFPAQAGELFRFHRAKLWHDRWRGASPSYRGSVLGAACVALNTFHAGR